MLSNCLPAPYMWQFLPNCRECGGTRQSPVNIRSKDVIRTKNIPPFDFRDLRNTRHVKMTMLNDGRRGECILDFLEIVGMMYFIVKLIDDITTSSFMKFSSCVKCTVGTYLNVCINT